MYHAQQLGHNLALKPPAIARRSHARTAGFARVAIPKKRFSSGKTSPTTSSIPSRTDSSSSASRSLLRVYFKYDGKLPTQLCRCAKERLGIFFRTMLGLDDRILCVIMVIHTFGDYARFHPHLYAIVADGLFCTNWTFHCLSKRDLTELEEIFRSKLLEMLKRRGGFIVHAGNRCLRPREGRNPCHNYILRNVVPEQKACPEQSSRVSLNRGCLQDFKPFATVPNKPQDSPAAHHKESCCVLPKVETDLRDLA